MQVMAGMTTNKYQNTISNIKSKLSPSSKLYKVTSNELYPLSSSEESEGSSEDFRVAPLYWLLTWLSVIILDYRISCLNRWIRTNLPPFAISRLKSPISRSWRNLILFRMTAFRPLGGSPSQSTSSLPMKKATKHQMDNSWRSKFWRGRSSPPSPNLKKSQKHSLTQWEFAYSHKMTSFSAWSARTDTFISEQAAAPLRQWRRRMGLA